MFRNPVVGGLGGTDIRLSELQHVFGIELLRTNCPGEYGDEPWFLTTFFLIPVWQNTNLRGCAGDQ